MPETEKKKPLTLGDKIAAANQTLSGTELAAAQRADKVRALEEELEGYKRTGRDERAEAVEAALRATKSAPTGRQPRGAGNTAQGS